MSQRGKPDPKLRGRKANRKTRGVQEQKRRAAGKQTRERSEQEQAGHAEGPSKTSEAARLHRVTCRTACSRLSAAWAEAQPRPFPGRARCPS